MSSNATATATTAKSPVTDVTVYGATSFTAKHVLSYLLRSSVHVLSSSSSRALKITLAGRNESKLKALRYKLSETMKKLILLQNSSSPGCRGAEFDVFVAEASEVDNIRAMVARTKVILSCAGPFSKYSTEVVAACAELGTDYVDITGEVEWASEMRQKHSEASKKSGSRIVSFCGFDSIPSDVAVFAAVEALRNKAGKETQVDKATNWIAAHGFLNAGTVHTVEGIPVRFWKCILRWVPFLVNDPLALTHPSVQADPGMTATRNRLAMAEWRNLLPIFHTFLMGGASGPYLMAVVNAKVVHESALSLKYGNPDTFVYNERHLPVGFRGSIHLKAFSVIAVILTELVLLLCVLIIKLPFLGPMVCHAIFPVGSGMSDEACQDGYVEIYAEVQSKPVAIAAAAMDKVNKGNSFLKFKGDPANWVTSQCVSEAALCLLLDREQLPPRSVDGFGSPVETLGGTLLKRLTESKVRPVEYSTNVRIATEKREWTMFQ